MEQKLIPQVPPLPSIRPWKSNRSRSRTCSREAHSLQQARRPNNAASSRVAQTAAIRGSMHRGIISEPPEIRRQDFSPINLGNHPRPISTLAGTRGVQALNKNSFGMNRDVCAPTTAGVHSATADTWTATVQPDVQVQAAPCKHRCKR